MKKNRMKKTLILFGHYYPDVNAGGPIQSLRNLTNSLKEHINFFTIASDTEFGTDKILNHIKSDEWNNIEGVEVFFTDTTRLSVLSVRDHIIKNRYDSIYINSIFSWKFSIYILVLKKIGKLNDTKIILAPRGSFSEGALENSKFKKKLFLKIANLINLYEGVNWHATTKMELDDIKGNVHNVEKYDIIQNLVLEPKLSLKKKIPKNNELRIIFLSRIHPKKNLYGALSILQNVEELVIFDIYGPIEDETYWDQCKRLIFELPNNVVVNYKGTIKNEEVYSVFQAYHLFFFPTFGENFGHVIYESLISGCPVLTSDQTPWNDLEEYNAGFSYDLNFENKFVSAIKRIARMDDLEYYRMSLNSKKYAKIKINNKESIKGYKKLFEQWEEI